MFSSINNNNKTITLQTKSQKGFTLVEMAIVLMIVGLVLASVAQLTAQRLEWLKQEETRVSVEQEITVAIEAFLNTRGRYPCPASLTAKAGDNSYGREFDRNNCADDSVNLTVAANGIATVTGRHPTAGGRVRIGAVPFKELNLRESDALDGYGNKIIYAVTEDLTGQIDFNPNNGEIEVQDDTENTISNTVHYIVYSTGKEGFGAYNYGGTQPRPCPMPDTTLESQNCDFSDAIFTFGDRGAVNNAEQFDDIVMFANQSEQWRDTNPANENIEDEDEEGEEDDGEEDVSSDDITTILSDGKKGIGAGLNGEIREELDVGGTARAQDDPLTETNEGEILSNALCDYGSLQEGETPTCFPSALIGGQDGIGCNEEAGEFILGIRNGNVVCSDKLTLKCDDGYMLQGINPDGTLKCNAPPLICPELEITLCDAPYTIPAGEQGDKHWAKRGTPENEKTLEYTCRDRRWQLKRDHGGLCECEEEVIRTETARCATPWRSCGDRFSGTKTRERYRICPSGDIRVRDIDTSGCTCIETSKRKTESCPHGFTSGHIEYESTHDCSTRTCSPYVEIDRTCKCTPRERKEPRACPSGTHGTYFVERVWECHNGENEPGRWAAGSESSWEEVEGEGIEDRCSCETDEWTDEATCPDGMLGMGSVQVTQSCPDEHGSPVITYAEPDYSNCKRPEDLTCTWEAETGARTSSENYGAGTVVGNECSCEDDLGQAAISCSEPRGSQHLHTDCTCQYAEF